MLVSGGLRKVETLAGAPIDCVPSFEAGRRKGKCLDEKQ